MFPRAILFDLDDTLISAYRQPERAWVEIAGEFADDLFGLSISVVAQAIAAAAEESGPTKTAIGWGDSIC